VADGQGVEELGDRHRRADVARGGPLLQQRAAWAVRQLRGRALALLPGRDLGFGRAVASETEAPCVNLEEQEEQQQQNEQQQQQQQQHKVDEPRRRGTMRPSPVATVRLPSAASADSASPRKPKVSRPGRAHPLSLQ
jgi:hypothetical protein